MPCVRADFSGNAQVVRLEEKVLDELVVRQSTQDAGEILAQRGKPRIGRRVAVRQARHAAHGAVHGQPGVHARLVVLLHVAADEHVALAEADGVEALAQLGVRQHRLRKHVHGVVHVEQEAIDGVRHAGLSRRNAHRVHPQMLSDVLRDALHAPVEAAVAHAMRQHHGQPVRASCSKRLGPRGSLGKLGHHGRHLAVPQRVRQRLRIGACQL
mmetsp:Transcript_9808/g.36941  ORF Transcript_9808/g.36941 Transcript_9808/m.36941 type:complete len:212 (+) Transcript_9808:1099-1734(+)